MTALTRYFFHEVDVPRDGWEIVRWWERRRPAYNVAVGSAGLTTLGVMSLLFGPPPLVPMLLVVGAYGVAANLCYTLGPVLDILARRWGGPGWAPIGPALLRHGFTFAIGLTLLPIPMIVLGWMANLLLD